VALGGKLGDRLTDDCMARRLKRIAWAAGLDRLAQALLVVRGEVS
jgi:hypothetical protein